MASFTLIDKAGLDSMAADRFDAGSRIDMRDRDDRAGSDDERAGLLLRLPLHRLER